MSIRFLSFIVITSCALSSYAYVYNTTPAGSANPPALMSEDPSVPITPNIYAPPKPISKTPPPGTVAIPGATNNNNTNFAPVYQASPQ
jgi:hypothetical protein